MKTSPKTGIEFDRIILSDLTYKTNLAFKGTLVLPEIRPVYRYQISVDKQRQRKVLQCTLSCQFFDEGIEQPFTLSLTILALFESELEIPYPLEEFAKLQAPAYMMPYVRELVSNITARTVYPTLNLPPINLSQVLRQDRTPIESAPERSPSKPAKRKKQDRNDLLRKS